MSIYVHFHIHAQRAAVRLHNVARIDANGPDSIAVRFMFADNVRTFSDVSHVAVQPDRA